LTYKELEVIKQKVIINASPEEVYDAYVNPKKHAEFTGSPTTGTPKVGGKFTAWDGYISGKYIVLVEGKKIVHKWKTTEWPAGYPPSLVKLNLRKKGKVTELTMIHTDVPSEQAEEYARGWKDFYWNPLKERFSKKR